MLSARAATLEHIVALLERFVKPKTLESIDFVGPTQLGINVQACSGPVVKDA